MQFSFCCVGRVDGEATAGQGQDTSIILERLSRPPFSKHYSACTEGDERQLPMVLAMVPRCTHLVEWTPFRWSAGAICLVGLRLRNYPFLSLTFRISRSATIAKSGFENTYVGNSVDGIKPLRGGSRRLWWNHDQRRIWTILRFLFDDIGQLK